MTRQIHTFDQAGYEYLRNIPNYPYRETGILGKLNIVNKFISFSPFEVETGYDLIPTEHHTDESLFWQPTYEKRHTLIARTTLLDEPDEGWPLGIRIGSVEYKTRHNVPINSFELIWQNKCWRRTSVNIGFNEESDLDLRNGSRKFKNILPVKMDKSFSSELFIEVIDDSATGIAQLGLDVRERIANV